MNLQFCFLYAVEKNQKRRQWCLDTSETTYIFDKADAVIGDREVPASLAVNI
jgi:hypothetical protein